MTSSRFTTLDLSRLPAPQLIEEIDFEAVFAAAKAYFIATWDLFRQSNPSLPAIDTLNLDSEPSAKILQTLAFRETVLRALVNDKARKVLLAFAHGTDLDHIAADYEIERMTMAGDVPEDDERFRARIQLAPNAFSTLGPYGAFVFWAMTVSNEVKAAHAVAEVANGKVKVYVAGYNGAPVSSDGLSAIFSWFKRDDVCALTDDVTVLPADVVLYDLDLTLQLRRGPDPATVALTAQSALRAYAASRYEIEGEVFNVGVSAAAKVGGVENVLFNTPFPDLICQSHQIPWLRNLTVNTEVI